MVKVRFFNGHSLNCTTKDPDPRALLDGGHLSDSEGVTSVEPARNDLVH